MEFITLFERMRTLHKKNYKKDILKMLQSRLCAQPVKPPARLQSH